VKRAQCTLISSDTKNGIMQRVANPLKRSVCRLTEAFMGEGVTTLVEAPSIIRSSRIADT
jgi:hypothetical protein